mgnify:CR=1 FL=1
MRACSRCVAGLLGDCTWARVVAVVVADCVYTTRQALAQVQAQFAVASGQVSHVAILFPMCLRCLTPSIAGARRS